jgi:hypothetical protein
MRNKIKLLLVIALLSGNYLAANAAGTVRIVTTTADSGPGSLRDAFAALAGNGANGSDVDTIRFDPSLKGNTIVLASPLFTTTSSKKNFVLDGEDNNITISGDDKYHFFAFPSTYRIEISNLTLTAGYSASSSAVSFGSQASGDTYTLNNVRFESNTRYGAQTTVSGGAINIGSNVHVIVNHCTFTGNKAQVAGIPNANYGGAAIYSQGTVEIYNSLFENNSTTSSGGAVMGVNLTVTGCVFKNNSAGIYGGAIAVRNVAGQNANILGNTFIGNTAENATFGGGVFGANSLAAGDIFFAANVFQDNTSTNSADNNEFYHSGTGISITSAGYNVFKGAVPAAGTNSWSGGVTTDHSAAEDIAKASSGRISAASPAFQIVTTEAFLIEGLGFPETDIFGNASDLPYNAGADQGDGVLPPEDIIAEQPLVYRNGTEKNIGLTLVDTPPLSFENIGFSIPAGLAFTGSSAALKEGTAFTLAGVSVSDGDNGAATRLQLSIRFAPAAELEYTDTLIISAEGANDFVIPLRGVGISWTAAPEELQDFGRIAVGSVSEAQTVTVTGSSASGTFSYSLKNGQDEVFLVSGAEGYSAEAGGDLEIRFAPATAGAAYKDTLVIGSADSERTFEISLSGNALPVAVASSLSFGEVVISAGNTLTLPVTVASGFGVSIPTHSSNDPAFIVEESDNWSPLSGGDLLVTFTPTEARAYSATLTLSGEGNGFSSATVTLEGTGLARPVVSSEPVSLDFSAVVQGESKSETVTVTLSNPQSLLTGDDVFSFAVAAEGIFEVVSVEPVGEASDAASVVEVTLSFTPATAVEYLDTLIVHADYAEEYRIPLSGTGFKPTVTSDPTSIDFGETVVGASKSETVTVTLSDPSAPLTASAFSLAVAAEGIFEVVSVEPVGEASDAVSVVEVTLSFTPAAAVEYLDTLIVRADYAEEYRIPLSGTGFKPAVTSEPTSIDFGEAVVGASKSETVTVTLSDPFAPLTASAFSLAVAAEGIFEVVSVEPVGEASDAASVVEVTLSFTPAAVQEYLDTLIVRADYAEEYRIPLSGTGTSNVAISGPQAASPSLSVRNGDIVVSHASTGSRIFVYNLQGQALKMQTVMSDAEILETASFPRGVYIVAIRNDKQEILKRKVVL